MLREIGVYMQSVLNHWIAWGTGSSLTLVFWILDSILHWRISRWALLSFLTTGILISCFLAWREQYQENEASRTIGSLSLDGLEPALFQRDQTKEGAFQLGIILMNNQDRLVEYHVDKFDLMVESKQAEQKFANRGGYAYPSKPTIFRAATTPIPDSSKLLITGTLEYAISYHVVGSTLAHHTSKSLKFDVYTSPSVSIRYITVDEHED